MGASSAYKQILFTIHCLKMNANICCFFLQFSREMLADMYSAYIDNFLNAKDAVRIAKEAKPAFHKFLEVSVRDSRCPVISDI